MHYPEDLTTGLGLQSVVLLLLLDINIVTRLETEDAWLVRTRPYHCIPELVPLLSNCEVAKGCSRCILTTIDPQTGERNADREPLTTLKTYRERDGDVYFGQNLLPRGTGELRLGMPVEVLE